MKAVQINRYGKSDVIEINSHATIPVPNKDQVLIEVHAAAINPVDWKIREGMLRDMMPLPFPATLGTDFAGVIKQVGENVSDLKAGDEVFGWSNSVSGNGSGSFAELMTTDATTVAIKPKEISFLEAAALPVVGSSAWQALVRYIKITKGMKVLIHGGTGGIGMIAIQIAKHFGAYVATTVSSKGIEFAKDMGADEVINYQEQAFESILQDYDAVLDTISGEVYQKSLQVLKKGGVIVSLIPGEPNAELMERYSVQAFHIFTEANRDDFASLAKLMADRKLKVIIDKSFAIDEAAKALDYLQNSHPRGKVVLQIR